MPGFSRTQNEGILQENCMPGDMLGGIILGADPDPGALSSAQKQ